MNRNFIQDSVEKLEQIFYVESVMFESIILLPKNVPAMLFELRTRAVGDCLGELFYIAIGAPTPVEALETAAYCD
jgi:hypothetical protein